MGSRWTLKDVVQGKPLHHPSHPMFVHFPVAFYFGALGLDVLSRLGRFPAAPLAATWLLIGAFAGTVFAALTGLVDWWGMVPGSRKRRWATWHMLLQLTTLGIFLVDFPSGGRTVTSPKRTFCGSGWRLWGSPCSRWPSGSAACSCTGWACASRPRKGPGPNAGEPPGAYVLAVGRRTSKHVPRPNSLVTFTVPP